MGTPSRSGRTEYFSADNVIGGGDTNLGQTGHFSAVAAGANYSDGFSINIPNVSPGNYFLILRADVDDNLRETSESNNDLAVPILLAVATSTPTMTSTATDTATATATITATATDTATPTPTATSAVAVCEPAPRNDCAGANLSLLKLSDNADPAKRKLMWKWSFGTASITDFGQPDNGPTNYAFCVYDDGVLKMSPAIAGGGTCSGKPCWKASATGYQFKDKLGNAAGITQMKLKEGAGTALIQVKGKGSNLNSPFPIADATAVTVQLVRNPGAAVEC